MERSGNQTNSVLTPNHQCGFHVFRMSTWMDALMAPGTRGTTSHVHLVEGFSVLTIACLQTVDLMQVKILVGQIQQ